MNNQELLNKVKESLNFDQRTLVFDLLDRVQNATYEAAFTHGIETFSWMRDGVRYVGTCGMTLESAKARLKHLHGYTPEMVDWTGKGQG